jgi:hypothetical protein
MSLDQLPPNDGVPTGDLLVGAPAIQAFLADLGMPSDTNVYYLRHARQWPIGNTSGKRGKLIASKQRLRRYADELARGPGVEINNSQTRLPGTAE